MTTDETVIIASLSATALITYVNKVATRQEVTIKPLINMFIAGSLLLLIAMWNVSVAAMFATLLLITSLVLNGKTFFEALSKV